MPRLPPRRPRLPLCRTALALLLAAGPAIAHGDALPASPTAADRTGTVPAARLDAALAQLPAQRPGIVDMYVLGVAGDSDEDVFRNEVVYLQQLSTRRWNAEGRMLSLINPPQARETGNSAPQASRDTLRQALAALGRTLDPAEDVLFLYMSSHGLDDNSFYLHTAAGREEYLAPSELAQMLEQAGIGNAVIVVSACYSGGFIPALKAPNRMIITAARKDRPSFGCGNTDSATWFGRAFLVEALNRTNDFSAAYSQTKLSVRQREKQEGELPSEPQFHAGMAIAPVLASWRASLPEAGAVPYPFVHRPQAAPLARPRPPAALPGNRKRGL